MDNLLTLLPLPQRLSEDNVQLMHTMQPASGRRQMLQRVHHAHQQVWWQYTHIHTPSPPACLRSHASCTTFTSQQVQLRVVEALALMPMAAQLQATSLSSQTARQSPAKHRSKSHPKAAAAASHAARQADAAGGVGRPPRGDARGGDGRAQVADARQGGAVEEDGRGGGLVPADWMTVSLCAAMMSVSLCWTLGTAPAQCPPTTAARHSLKSCHSDRRDTSAAQAAALLPAPAPAPALALAMAARHPPGTNQQLGAWPKLHLLTPPRLCPPPLPGPGGPLRLPPRDLQHTRRASSSSLAGPSSHRLQCL